VYLPTIRKTFVVTYVEQRKAMLETESDDNCKRGIRLSSAFRYGLIWIDEPPCTMTGPGSAAVNSPRKTGSPSRYFEQNAD